MPRQAIITPDKFFPLLKKVITKELKGRMLAVKRQTVKLIAEKSQENIDTLAPEDDELNNYSKDLATYMVKGDKNHKAAYGVLFDGKVTTKSSKLNKKTTILYIKPIKAKSGKWSEVFRLLYEFGPFTIETWPVKIPKKEAWIVYRTVSEREAKAIKKRNIDDRRRLVKKIYKYGINIKSSDFKVRGMNVIDEMEFDLSFNVLRKELGLGGEKRTPHWRPGIKHAISNGSLKKILKNKETKKCLSNPNYSEWKTLGKIKKKVSASELKEIEPFQKMIIGD